MIEGLFFLGFSFEWKFHVAVIDDGRISCSQIEGNSATEIPTKIGSGVVRKPSSVPHFWPKPEVFFGGGGPGGL